MTSNEIQAVFHHLKEAEGERDAAFAKLAAVRDALGDWDYDGLASDVAANKAEQTAAELADAFRKAHRAWLFATGKAIP